MIDLWRRRFLAMGSGLGLLAGEMGNTGADTVGQPTGFDRFTDRADTAGQGTGFDRFTDPVAFIRDNPPPVGPLAYTGGSASVGVPNDSGWGMSLAPTQAALPAAPSAPAPTYMNPFSVTEAVPTYTGGVGDVFYPTQTTDPASGITYDPNFGLQPTPTR